MTLERATLATGTDVAGATVPDGPGAAAKLTIYCGYGETAGSRPAYREAVDVLRRHGATGAIVLLGVDGGVAGRRAKARLFAGNGETPVVIISVGPPRTLERSLPHLRECLRDPVVTLENIAQLKHDGELLEAPPALDADGDDPEVWHTLRIYSRRSALVDGRSLHSELIRRIREVGGAGVTTIAGEWGFSSDETAVRRPPGSSGKPCADLHGVHRPPAQGRRSLADRRRHHRRARDRHVARRARVSRAGRRHRPRPPSCRRPGGAPSGAAATDDATRVTRPRARARLRRRRCRWVRSLGEQAQAFARTPRVPRGVRARDARGRRPVLPRDVEPSPAAAL